MRSHMKRTDWSEGAKIFADTVKEAILREKGSPTMPTFHQRHFNYIAEIIGNLPVLSDQSVQVIVEEFGKAFELDNEKFDFQRFQSKVTRVREGKL